MFQPNSTIGWSIGRLRSTARELLAFVRSPTVAAAATGDDRKPSDVAWLFLLNCLIVLIIAMILFPLMMAFGVEMSSDMSALFDRPVWQIMLIVVVGGPVVEELMFRIWISGAPRLLVLFGGLISWVAGSFVLDKLGFGQTALVLLILAISRAVLVALIRFWKSSVPHWYARIFPIVFWGQALLFGFVHLFNYAGDNPAALLPFILPQLVGGLIWGYARILYGWWSNIVMHMGYNLIAVSGLIYVLLAGSGAA